MRRKRINRISLVALCLVFFGVAGWLWLGNSTSSYTSPDGTYSLKYPKTWEPYATGGVVAFYDKQSPNAYRENVTIVMSKMAPGWREDFESTLEKGLSAIGRNYKMLGTKQVTLGGREVTEFTYALSLEGQSLLNEVYIFEMGNGLAAVMTCSALRDNTAAIEKDFKTIYTSFKINSK